MKKAKIYIPSKTAMQSGRGKTKKWVLKFETRHDVTNPLMGWESSDDTIGEVILEFTSKDKAVEYAKNNKLLYEVIEPKIFKSCLFAKSYSLICSALLLISAD